jgi:hypothetical protein
MHLDKKKKHRNCNPTERNGRHLHEGTRKVEQLNPRAQDERKKT